MGNSSEIYRYHMFSYEVTKPGIKEIDRAHRDDYMHLKVSGVVVKGDYVYVDMGHTDLLKRMNDNPTNLLEDAYNTIKDFITKDKLRKFIENE